MTCPMAESCLGCQYAVECARPAVQAAQLRGAVAALEAQRSALAVELEEAYRLFKTEERSHDATALALADLLVRLKGKV